MEYDLQMFINEYSLEGQFWDSLEFEEAVLSLISIVESINEKHFDCLIYKTALMENYRAIQHHNFRASLNKITNRDVKQHFIRIIFDKNMTNEWTVDQMHNENDSYTIQLDDRNPNVTGTSIAESAARKLIMQNIFIGLINFKNSSLPKNREIHILKNADTNIMVDTFDDRKDIDIWFEANFHISIFEYSIESQHPPNDKQTILRDKSRFQALDKICQGRRLYQELLTRKYWVVDNLHFGAGAHLEIFDKQGDHIGESDLNGNMIPGTGVLGRNIKFLL
jgi:hypothetical protein